MGKRCIHFCSFFLPLQSSYWFECLCEACKQNWPCFLKLPRDYFKLSGVHFKYKRCNRKALQKDVDKLKKRIRQTILDEKVPVTMLDEVPNHFEAARKMFHDWMNLLEELLMPASHQVNYLSLRSFIYWSLYWRFVLEGSSRYWSPPIQSANTGSNR